MYFGLFAYSSPNTCTCFYNFVNSGTKGGFYMLPARKPVHIFPADFCRFDAALLEARALPGNPDEKTQTARSHWTRHGISIGHGKTRS